MPGCLSLQSAAPHRSLSWAPEGSGSTGGPAQQAATCYGPVCVCVCMCVCVCVVVGAESTNILPLNMALARVVNKLSSTP